jgi:hypothetical protein
MESSMRRFGSGPYYDPKLGVVPEKYGNEELDLQGRGR